MINWQIDPNLEDNAEEMRKRFTGYSSERDHYPHNEMRLFRDPAYMETTSRVFSRIGIPINLYVWQSRDPDYDKTSFHQRVNTKWLHDRMGDAADKIIQMTTPDAITVILTNNMSDDNWMSIRSPWMLAHRISHAIFDNHRVERKTDDVTYRLGYVVRDFVYRIMTLAYGVSWHSDYRIGKEYTEAYGKILGHAISTMRSARKGNINNVYEWVHELFSQKVITGKITLNPLPDILDELPISQDPEIRRKVLKLWATFPQRCEEVITKALETSRGEIFVC